MGGAARPLPVGARRARLPWRARWWPRPTSRHAYPDGACLYFTFAGRPPEDLASDGAGQARLDWVDRYYRQAWDRVTQATMDAGGAISHHHGIGLNRARFLPAALGSGFEVLASLKDALDPHGILNPGKLGLTGPFGPVPWP